jgi:hypothetical protein
MGHVKKMGGWGRIGEMGWQLRYKGATDVALDNKKLALLLYTSAAAHFFLLGGHLRP